jgi:hypothetical protein
MTYSVNQEKAAKAIVRGFTLADVCKQPNGQRYVPTVVAVRKAIARFAAAH